MPDGVPFVDVNSSFGLTDHVWQLSGGAPPRPIALLILLPSGRIGAAWNTGLIWWERTDRQLDLMGQDGTTRLRFELTGPDQGVLDGHAAPDGAACRLERLRALPKAIERRYSPAANTRRNLVVVRAGPDSLHAAWLLGCSDTERNWDLCVCSYGSEVPHGAAEYKLHRDGSKFEGLAALLGGESFWLAYDYVWLPDDDLMTGWQDINRLFELCRLYGLALAQPSLAQGSFLNHPIMQQSNGLLLRFTSFVEIMAPVFSKAALSRVAATFALNPSGYGLDHLWPAILDVPPTAIAVIDAVSVLHTRPIGASYDRQRAMHDGWALEDEFHEVNRYEVYGAIAANPAGYAKRHGMMISET
jgi:hypothetical protein